MPVASDRTLIARMMLKRSGTYLAAGISLKEKVGKYINGVGIKVKKEVKRVQYVRYQKNECADCADYAETRRDVLSCWNKFKNTEGKITIANFQPH